MKFIRFAQLKMDEAPEGVVGIITNHSWLDNPTFRGMRQSLTRSFDQIYVLDLHGSTKPREYVPDGTSNGNVFDITKGVAITLFIKNATLDKGLKFAEIWGSRQEKYEFSAGSSYASIDWEDFSCFSPYYMLRPLNWTGWEKYELGWPLSDTLNPPGQNRQIFLVGVLGFQTHRDGFAIAYSAKIMAQRLELLRNESVSDETLVRDFGLKSNRDWNLKTSRAALRKQMPTVSRVAYRPFDDRWSEFGPITMDYPRKELIDHVAGRDSPTLLVPRQVGSPHWRHAAVAAIPAESCYVDNDSKSQNYVFPLSLSSDVENFSPDFRDYLDARYDHHYTPEEILGYIYAVLHAPAYRARYAEFLRIDFPRIPFAETRPQFDALSDLGWDLVRAHLLKAVPHAEERLGGYSGKGEHEVEAVRYSPEERKIWINKTQGFEAVPQAVWDFHIGGYQVLDKYLKSRKGRTLSLDEQTHVGEVAEALAFTIKQMARIDEAYLAAFPNPSPLAGEGGREAVG